MEEEEEKAAEVAVEEVKVEEEEKEEAEETDLNLMKEESIISMKVKSEKTPNFDL